MLLGGLAMACFFFASALEKFMFKKTRLKTLAYRAILIAIVPITIPPNTLSMKAGLHFQIARICWKLWFSEKNKTQNISILQCVRGVKQKTQSPATKKKAKSGTLPLPYSLPFSIGGMICRFATRRTIGIWGSFAGRIAFPTPPNTLSMTGVVQGWFERPSC